MEKMVSKLEISPVQISLRNTLVKHDWYKCKEDATNTQYEDVEVPALTNLKFRISIKLEISVKWRKEVDTYYFNFNYAKEGGGQQKN